MAKGAGAAAARRRAAAAAAGARVEAESGAAGGPAAPRHLDRKLARKSTFLKKVARSGAVAKKSSRAARKRGALQGSFASDLLAELAGAGGPAAKAARRVPATKSPRHQATRQTLLSSERTRMAAVTAHPAYQSDPLGAIAKHLIATTEAPTATATRRADPKRPNKARGR